MSVHEIAIGNVKSLHMCGFMRSTVVKRLHILHIKMVQTTAQTFK